VKRLLAIGSVGLLALFAASSAAASTTIGQLPAAVPPNTCNNPTAADGIQATVNAGNSYVVPPGSVKITSWSTYASASAGRTFEMKIFRKVAEPATYLVVGHDGPHPLTPGQVNTFATDIAVQPGDLLGMNDASTQNACLFVGTGSGDVVLARNGDLADGVSSAGWGPLPGSFLINMSAAVAFQASNTFTVGKVKRNKSNGTARVAVDVPGSGTLSLRGKGVKTQRSADAVASKAVTAAGRVHLRINAKGTKSRKLGENGKVKVKVKITFAPNGASSGDVPAPSATQTKRIKLIELD
jgi:hypothetical protein